MSTEDQNEGRGLSLRQGLIGAAAMMAVLTVISRVLGMVRQMIQAHEVGANAIGDVYNRANTISNVLFEVVVGGALASALIPVIAGSISRRDLEKARTIVAGVMGWVLVVLVPLGVVMALASGPLATALNLESMASRTTCDSQGATVEDLRSATQFFLLVFSVQIPLYGLTVLANGVLQAHRRFFWPAFTPVMSSLVVISTYLWYGQIAHGATVPSELSTAAINVLAWGTTAGVAAMCIPALVTVARMGYVKKPRLRFPAGVGPRLWSLAGAGIAGVVAYQISALVVVMTTGATCENGTFTVWVWTQQIYILPVAVFAIPLVTSAFPRLSSLASDGDHDSFAALSAVTARAVVIATGAGAAVLAAAAPPVALVFAVLDARGGSTVSNVLALMTPALTWTVIGLPGHALMYHGQRTLYAMQRAKASLVVGVVGWGAVSVGMVVGLLVGSVQLITMLSAAYAVGVLIGGVTSALVVARVAGRPAVAGLARTCVVVAIGAVIAAVGGRWVADSVIMLAGKDIWQALGAGVGAGLVGLVLVLGVLVLGDRAGVRDLVQMVRRRGTD
ncbi:MAG: virulence factor MviN [Micrococcales bacterium]|nr:virulence factor MviN [Micrococcales bacterium]MCL2668157.1 virulence factor MviN [Micrococcales bacterium]